jgi:hypothetical protein
MDGSRLSDSSERYMEFEGRLVYEREIEGMITISQNKYELQKVWNQKMH